MDTPWMTPVDADRDRQFYPPWWKVFICGVPVIVLYFFLFMAFYNQIVYKRVWAYESLEEAAGIWLLNGIGFMLHYVVIFAVVFIIPLPRRLSPGARIAANALLCIIGTMTVSYVMLMTPFVGNVDWAGIMFNSTMEFMGIEVAWYVIESKANMMRTVQARKAAYQFRFNALQSQVNPHFLFNSLNILYALIGPDEPKAREFLLALTRIYRYQLGQPGRDRVTLADELDYLASYMEVLSMRYSGNLKMKITGDADACSGRFLVPFTLQLLLENVIKHNAITAATPMTVTVTVNHDGIWVSNPVIPKYSAQHSGFGLRYLRDMYHGRGTGIIVENGGPGGRFSVFAPFFK